MTDAPPVENVLKRRLAAGEPALVMSLRLARTVDIVGLVAASGHDGFYIDLQHCTMPLETAAQICTAGVYAGVTPLVRVPAAEEGLCARLLDGGAMGIIVPDVQSAAQARAIASWCRFPPRGVRSASGPLALARHRALPLVETAEIANAETLVICMLEGGDAIAAADEIAAVDGVDALFIGANDLTNRLGIPGQLEHARVRDAFAAAITAAKRHGKHLLIGGIRDPRVCRLYLDMGAAPMLFTGFDSAFLAEIAKAKADAFRALFETR